MGRQKIICRSKQIVCANEDSKEITAIAKKRGIRIPSSHLGFFKTIYAKIEEPNLNHIRLAKHAVDDALPGLIGSQVNFEHLGAGFLCGTILDAWVNDKDEIEVVYSFFKSIYPDEYARSLELASEGELAVSFELLSERESQEWLSDGTIRLHDIDFQGMGHLMDNPPACPQAKIYEFASRCKERLSTIDERELVFASEIEKVCDGILEKDEASDNPTLPDSDNESDKHKDILANQTETKDESEQGGDINVTEEQKARVEQLRAELGDLVKDISDEDLLNDAVVAEIRKEQEATKAEPEAEKAETEEKAEETEEKAEEKSEEAEPVEEKAEAKEEEAEAEKAEAESEEKAETEPEKEEEKAEETPAEAEEKSEEEKAYKETIETNDKVEITDDGSKSEVKQTTTVVQTVDWEAKAKELEAQVEELEKSLKAKDSEIETIKANADKIATVKIQLKDNPFAKDFTDEDFLDDEKVAKATEDQKKAETVASRKEELKENEYAKDFSDEDYLNDDKVELAKVKKEKDELEAKGDKLTDKIEASTKEEDMSTGSAEEKTDDYQSVMASVRQEIKEKRESQKVYTKR